MERIDGTRVFLALVLSLAVLYAATPVQALPEDHSQWSDPVFHWAYKLIATPEEMTVLDTLARSQKPEFLRKFWQRRDPTPATEVNEFKQQFTERVDVAADHYRAVPTAAPWDRRGDVYIKLGPPDDIEYRVHGWYQRIPYGPPIDPSSTLMDEGEIWYYFDRNLTLQFQPDGPDMNIVPLTTFYGRQQPQAVFADKLHQVETTHVAYEPPTGQKLVAAVMECYPFRRTDGVYDVYVVSAIPLGAMAQSTGWKSAEVEYTAHVTAFDSTLKRVWIDSVRVHQGFAHVPRDHLAQNHFATRLPAGFYSFAVELEDPAGKKHAIATNDRWLVPYADTVQLDLSPLVLAADIRPAAAESNCPFVRNDREIVAAPGHIFNDDQDICFYHEVYNLAQNDSGQCSYTVEYALYDIDNDVRNNLTTQTLQSAERHTFQMGRIPHEKVEKGSYILEVRTTDLVAGSTKTALTRLKVD